MLDIARKSFDYYDIRFIIGQVAELGGKYVQLHFCDSNHYAIESKVLGNPANPDGRNENKSVLSLNEIKQLSEYAKSLGIELIPELELPAHSNKLLDLLFNHNWDYWNSVRTHEGGYQLHLGSPETYRLVKELIAELMGAFTNTKTIHLGGDEFEFGTENTPVNVCNFFNNLQLWILETYNCRTKVWNDFITKDILQKGLLNTRIDVVYWSQSGEATKGSEVEAERLRTRATAQEISDYGNNLWNSTAWFCYSVPNDTRDFTNWNSVYAGRDQIERWDLSVFGYQNTFTRLKDTSKVLGQMMCIWTEHIDLTGYHTLAGRVGEYAEYHMKAIFDITNSYNIENVITANDLLNAKYKFYIFDLTRSSIKQTEVIGKFQIIATQYNMGYEMTLVPFNDDPVTFTVENEDQITEQGNGYLVLNGTKILWDPTKIKYIRNEEFYNEATEMPLIRFEKLIHSLPSREELKPNTVYYVRAGAGFDTYVSDATGSIAHRLNLPNVSPQTNEKSWIDYITKYQFKNYNEQQNYYLYENQELSPSQVYRIIKDGYDTICSDPTGNNILAKRKIS